MKKEIQVPTFTYNPCVYIPEDELEDENVYVNTTECTVDKRPAASDMKIPPIIQSLSPVAACWGLLLVIMVLRIHFTSVISAKLRDQMKGSEEANQYFKYVTNDLFLTNENLESEYSNLKVQIDKMAQAYAVLESNYKDLSGENEQLRAENERVMRGGLTTPIPTAMQYGVESYPPYYSRKKRQSEACQTGWLHFRSSCYSISNPDPPDQKTWEEARDDCRGKNADLVVIDSSEEQSFIHNSSLANLGADGCWIGLRVEGRSWKWVNGGHLTEDHWIQQPADSHHCGISAKEANGWKAVSCDVNSGWICEENVSSV